MSKDEIKKMLLAGFERFRSEGFTRWSQQKLEQALHPRGASHSLSDSEVQAALEELASEGRIELRRTPDEYVVVLDA